MISIGRRNKSLVLAVTLVFVFLLFLWTPSREAVPLVSSMERASLGIGNPTVPTNDEDKPSIPQNDITGDIEDEANTLLSSAKIEKAEARLKDVKNAFDSASAKVNTPESSKLNQDTTDKNEESSEVLGESSSLSEKPAAKVSSSNENYEYVIMIDAGSTGSRVHVYTFDTSVSPPKLLNEEFEMLKPGLSYFDTDTVGAAASLDPLLKVALDSIPEDKQSCSPVAVKATAGLRLLGAAKSDAILKEVRSHLEKDYPFPVVEGNGVSIMGGSDEGVYAWITANYLLGNIGSSKKEATAAVFDLGGGSTQIVFEPLEGETMIEGEHKYEITFGGREFVLYQYSHLGYGLMQGRRKVNAAVLQAELDGGNTLLKPISSAEAKDDTTVASVTIENPCVPPGVKANNVVVEMDDETTYIVNFISPASTEKDNIGASTQCRFLSDSILNKQLECESKSCSFNGIYQPSLKNQFSKEADMYVFSYFYDRLQPIGMPLSFTLQEMKALTELVCSGSTLWNEYFPQKNHIKELEEEPLWCMDLTFMISLLHIGYDIPLKRELRTAKTIDGNELGWCLGASLPLLDKGSGWTCKVKKDF